MKGLLTGALVATLLAGAAVAQPLDAEARAALDARIAQFEAALDAGDARTAGEVVPPKMLAVMAERFGLEPAQLLDLMAAEMAQTMQDVTVETYDMDMEAATTGVTPTGRAYMIIPTTTRVVVDSQRMEGTSPTLAFADEGTWYLVRIDGAQQAAFLAAAYPEFADVTFPASSMTFLED